MHGLGESKLFPVVMSVALLNGSMGAFPARAQQPPANDRPPSVAPAAAPSPLAAPPTALLAPDLTASLDQARELIKTRDYDNAIQILTTLIQSAKNPTGPLRDAYLLLIKTYVFIGAEAEQTQQGRDNARLDYKRARELIVECLSIRELRHTRPEPAAEYPDKMVLMFDEVRGEIFGSFRVAELHPNDAVVLLDADTLRRAPGESFLGDQDVAVGKHLVAVRRRGYRSLTEEIEISPGATVERSYRATRSATPVIFGGVSIATVREDSPVISAQRKLGFAGGVGVVFPVMATLSIEPDIVYVMKGFSDGRHEETDGSGNATGRFFEALYAVDYIEIPVLARAELRTGTRFRPSLFAGPFIAAEVRERFVLTGSYAASANVDRFVNMDLGITVGLGLAIAVGPGRWLLDGRYDHGLLQIERATGADWRSAAFQLTTGWSFGARP